MKRPAPRLRGQTCSSFVIVILFVYLLYKINDNNFRNLQPTADTQHHYQAHESTLRATAVTAGHCLCLIMQRIYIAL